MTATVALALALGAIYWAPFLLRTLSSARALGAAAPLAFIAVHVLGVIAFVPATPFAVAGGALFGFGQGLAYSFVGGLAGATAAFLIARYGVRRILARRFSESAQVAALDHAIAADGARILLLLRLSPIMPFNVLNYALGTGSVRLRDFVFGSAAGGLPGTMVAVYAGDLAGEALALAGKAHPVWSASYYVAIVAGLIATIAATVVVARAARRALRKVA